MIRKLIFTLLIASAGITGLIGQSQKAFINAADKAYIAKDYYSALSYYSTALEFDSTRTDLKYLVAESARGFSAYTTAIAKYNEVLESDQASDYPLINYYLGDLYHKVGQYDSSVKSYELFQSEYGDRYQKENNKATLGRESARWALDQVENSDESITINHLGESINSPYSEFGAYNYKGDLVYSSMRYENEVGKSNPKKLISKLLKSTDGGNGETIEGDINASSKSIANSAFDESSNTLYYTICDYLTESDLVCKLYSRSIDGEGNFMDPQLLTINTESDSLTTTQPSIGGTGDDKFLYFSSNRDGGKGGMDIWRASISSNGSLGTPENLSAVNSTGDDITPFYHTNSNILYFSTDGRIGLGGYDVYSSDNLNSTFQEPIHQPAPINSSYNDIYYVLEGEEDKAYLSSNRLGSYYIESQQEACCYDVYEARIENVIIDLNTLTFDALTRDSLSGVTVKLIDPNSGEIIAEVTTLDGIDHNFQLRRNRNYIIVSEKEGFNPDTMMLSTRNIDTSEEIIKKVYLTTDRLLLDASTFDKQTLEELEGATLKIYDITDGGNELLFDELNPNGNNFKVYIDKDKKYRLEASKPDFTTAITEVDTSIPIEGQVITKKLYLDSNSLGDFLPLTLFFDNDSPDRRSRDFYTSKAYSDVYYPYVNRKEEFKRRLSRRGNTTESELIEAFFENDVKPAYNQLQEFLTTLYSYLNAGRGADIYIKGFTSPLANSKYNLALGQRRVASMKNELRRFKGGVLMPFIESGRLKITDVSFGEELAPSGVSDRGNDTRKSIYSVDASRERKVEIVRIKIN